MRFLWIACFLISAFRSPPVLAGQISDSLEGTILDPSRAPLPRATVRLLDTAGAEITRTITDSRGRFRFAGLTRAKYAVEATLAGFETVRVEASPGSDLQLALPLAPVREAIVVTATRTEAPTSQIGSSTTVLTDSEILQSQVLPVSDLLAAVPGIATVRTGGLGTVTSVFVRGGESKYNKVLLDGIPLNEPGGFFNFSNLMAENLERVEVVRGPQSALFGSDAMASVIQLFTRRGSPEARRPRFSLSGEGGNYDTWRSRAGVSGQQGTFDYSLHWARISTANREPNNWFHNTSLSSNLGYAITETTSLRLILRGELERVGTPGQTAFGRPDLDAYFRRRDGFGGFTVRNQTAAFWEQRITYTLSKTRQVSRDLVLDPPYMPSFQGRSAPFAFSDFLFDSLNDFRRHHTGYQSDWRAGSAGQEWGQHVFTFAFEWDRELGFLGDRLSGRVPTRAQRDNFGWTFQHQALWNRVVVANGLRVEDNESFGRSLAPRSSLAYFLRRGSGPMGATKLKFNFGLGIKEPSFLESFSPSPSFLGNPNLAAERARSFDFGAEQRFWHERGKLEINWFDNRFRNLIALRTLGFNPFRASYFNIGRTKAKGSEVVLELAPVRGVRGIGSYTFLDSQVTRSTNPLSPVFQEGRPLFRRPRHSGSLRLFWEWRQMNLASSVLFVGRRVDSDFSSLQPPLTSNDGYTRWDVAWSYRSSYRITYFGVIENLLNRDYMEALGFPALKRTARAGLRVEF